ncbi:MAG: DUF6291 domain-containing protein [Candidatus Faecousia sp.]|nr:DUF6291 domain-containing protein [Candidatus Faecousia sp.]
MSDTLYARNQFTFYRSFLEAACQLPKSHRGDFLFSLLCYGIYGAEPEGLHGAGAAVFTSIRPILDAGRAKSEARARTDCTDPGDWSGAAEDGCPVLPAVRDKNKTKTKNKTENQSEKKENMNLNFQGKKKGGAADAGRAELSLPEEDGIDRSEDAEIAATEADAEIAATEADAEADLDAAEAGSTTQISPRLEQLIRGDYGLSAAVRAYLEFWRAEGRPIGLREQEILSDQLRLTPPWDRIAAVEQAITAQSRSFRSFVPQSPPGTLR